MIATTPPTAPPTAPPTDGDDDGLLWIAETLNDFNNFV